MPLLGIRNLFSRKAAKNVVKEVVPEVKKITNYMKPGESILGTKPVKISGDLLEDIYQNNVRIEKLKDANAPNNLIDIAKSKFPLKYLPEKSVPVSYIKNSPRRMEKHNEIKIQNLLKNHEEEMAKRNQILNRLKVEYPSVNFVDAKITNPDEILELLKSNNFRVNVQTQMIDELAKTGNESHAKELLSGIDNVIRKISDDAKMESIPISIYDNSSNLGARLKAINKIGNEAQQMEVINKLRLELIANQNPKFVNKIYSAIGDLGKVAPDNSKYSEILLDQLFSENSKKVYPHLANFNGQFHIITKGMIENPESTEILAAAYKSAKTSSQKQILLREILGSETLTDTAIRSTTDFYDINTKKGFVADVLSEIKNQKQASLTSWQKWYLPSIMSS